MKRGSYGSATLRFGAGDRLLAMEVSRAVHQRPTFLAVSWFPLPVPVPAFDYDGFTRVILYRGAISDETQGFWTALQSQPWDSLDTGIEVFFDQFVPYRTPLWIPDFRGMPDEDARVSPNQPLGAAVLQPVELNAAAAINGDVNLTFYGTDMVLPDDDDVRKYRAK